MRFFYIVYFSYCLLLLSCSKKVEEKDFTAQNTALLLGSWKLTAMVSDSAYDWDGNGTVEADMFSVLDTCEKNQRITFQNTTNCLYQFDCNEIRNGVWKLMQNGSSLVFTFNDPDLHGSMSVWIKEISQTQMTVRINSVEPGNLPVKRQVIVLATYIKQ
jgi:hypothetical protein